MRLREMREKAGLSVIQLAEEIGTSRVTIFRWETGKNEPDLETVKTICCILGCTLDELLGSTNPTLPRAAFPGERKRKSTPEPVKRARGKRSAA